MTRRGVREHNGRVRRPLTLLLIAGLLAAAAGCANARARTVAEPPALEPPPPPPRLIQPVDFKSGDTARPVDDTPSHPTSTAKPPSAERPRTEKSKPDPSRETPQVKVEGPVEGPKPLPEVAKTPLLQAVPGEVEKKVRELIASADNYLSQVDYTNLNVDGQTQYDTAKRFISQARQAIAESNLVYAAKLADKAATLARLLPR